MTTNTDYYQLPKPETMTGISIVRKRCNRCHEYRQIAGCRIINRRFFCAGCVKELKL